MISLNLYINIKLYLDCLNAKILSAAGIKYKTKGYKSPNKKLNKESLINVIEYFDKQSKMKQ